MFDGTCRPFKQASRSRRIDTANSSSTAQTIRLSPTCQQSRVQRDLPPLDRAIILAWEYFCASPSAPLQRLTHVYTKILCIQKARRSQDLPSDAAGPYRPGSISKRIQPEGNLAANHIVKAAIMPSSALTFAIRRDRGFPRLVPVDPYGPIDSTACGYGKGGFACKLSCGSRPPPFRSPIRTPVGTHRYPLDLHAHWPNSED